MAQITITFKSNIEDVLAALDTATKRALAEIGATVQGAAKLNSPVRTGALRDSWTVDVNDSESSVTIGVPLDALDGNYAKYVELGTSRQRPQHVLGRAVDETKGQFANITKIELKNV